MVIFEEGDFKIEKLYFYRILHKHSSRSYFVISFKGTCNRCGKKTPKKILNLCTILNRIDQK